MEAQVLSGRKAQAARNDTKILDAARSVFLDHPEAPISDVAARAGVGISALYRRYPSKDRLLQELARDALVRFAADLRAALDDRGDAWTAYAACLHAVIAGQSQALAQRLAGSFTPTSELAALATTAGERYERLHRRTQRAGALRKDVTSADVVLLLEMVSLLRVPGPDGGAGLQQRYLALVLQSLHTSPANATLPGPSPDKAALGARWRRA